MTNKSSHTPEEKAAMEVRTAMLVTTQKMVAQAVEFLGKAEKALDNFVKDTYKKNGPPSSPKRRSGPSLK